MTLKLVNCNISDIGADHLLALFTGDRLPKGTCIDFTNNEVSPELIKKLKNAKSPLGIDHSSMLFGSTVKYENPTFLDKMVDKILHSSHHITQDGHLEVDLRYQTIGNAGAKLIANTIIGLQAPLDVRKFTLDVRKNSISHEGAIALAQALSSGNLPDETLFVLSNNELGGNHVTNAFHQAVKSGSCPSLIKLQFYECGMSDNELRQMDALIRARTLGLHFTSFFHNGATLLPLDLLKIVISYFTESSEILAIDLDKSLKMADVRSAYLEEKQYQQLCTPALVKLGFTAANNMDGNRWLFLLIKEMSSYGVTDIKATQQGLSIAFKDASSKSIFIQIENLEQTKKEKRASNPQELVIQDMNIIAHILHEYARIDISLVFPAANAPKTEYKKD